MPHKHPKRTEQPTSHNIPSHIYEAGIRAMAEYTRKMCEEDKSQWVQPIELTWGDEDSAQVWIKTKDDDKPYISSFLVKPLHTPHEEVTTYEERIINELSDLP